MEFDREIHLFLIMFTLMVGAFVVIHLIDAQKEEIQVKELTEGEVVARYKFWGSIMTDEQIKESVEFNDMFDVPDEYRSFPYLRIKK